MGRKKSAKRITWIFGALAAVITTVLISAYTFRPANISYKSVKAGTGSISTYYYFSGNVIAKNRQTILSEKMTQISKVLIKEGETVGINEVLMTTIGGDKIKS
jgi:multidrug efflux pump subunit AcrA (membrane-fusion protein)